MKTLSANVKLSMVVVVACVSAVVLRAADATTMSELKDQIRQLQRQLEQLQQKLAELESGNTNATGAVGSASDTMPEIGVDVGTRLPSAQPVTSARRGSFYADISLDMMGTVGWSTAQNDEVRTGHHAPYERGFSLRSAELTLEGAVDPYFKAASTVAFALERDGETAIELDEAWAQTTSLPWNLQVKGGQFYAAFGRQNAQHSHEWAFVDQPLVLNRFFGPDGLRQPGVQLSWLCPTAFYTELMIGVFNNHNTSFVGGPETAHEHNGEEHVYSLLHGGESVERNLRGPGDFVYVPRLCVSFDLSDTQTLLSGVSGAFGPNDSGPHANTQVYGVDLYWRWRPVDAVGGFPFVSCQIEALYRRYEAAERIGAADELLPAETLHDWGLYSQALWGFKRRWVAGLRTEFVSGNNTAYDSVMRRDRFRLSPNLTFYPTEYSKLRFQYNYDNRQGVGTDHSVWLQLGFMLGTHAAHKF